ncbi:unnamed protein product [Agarophyton chilense]
MLEKSDIRRMPAASHALVHEAAFDSGYTVHSQEVEHFDSTGHSLKDLSTGAESKLIPHPTTISSVAECQGVIPLHLLEPMQYSETSQTQSHPHLLQSNHPVHGITQGNHFAVSLPGDPNNILGRYSHSHSQKENNVSLRHPECPTVGEVRDYNQELTQYSHQEGFRINILSLDVVDCPLQKDGRHTIICGRLPDNHPYATAARRLGRYLISNRYRGVQECTSAIERKNNFFKDWKAFHEELLGITPKLPVIGGGELDIYSLMHEVLLLGGVLNVVKKRAFRVVAQQLELPKSCTSAASVLKNAYEKLLFYYEEKLVHDKMPEDVNRKLDMKRMAMEEKLKERKAAERLARMTASKRRSSGALDLLLDVGDCIDLVDENGYLDRDDPRLKRILLAVSDRPRITLNYLDLIVSNDIDDLLVPELEDTSTDDESFHIVFHDVIQMDEHEQVETGADVVLLALAECLPSCTLRLDANFERPKDLGLGKAICILPFCSPNMKRALGLLISAVIKASKLPSFLLLADKNSSHGFIDGLFYLLHRYLRHESSEDEEYEACETDVLSAAYCALSVIQMLVDEEQNRPKIISNVGFRYAIGRFLGYEDSSRSFLLVMLDIITKCCTMMVDLLSERDMDLFVSSLVQRLEMATGLDPEAPLEHEVKKGLDVPPDYEISSKVLPILVTLARKMGIKCRNSGRLIELCVRMLHCQERIADNTNLALIVHTIAERFPNMIASNRDLVRGVLKLVRDATCVDIAAETLIIINRTLPVRELVLESGLFSGWKQCAADRDAPLTHLVESLSDETEQAHRNHFVADIRISASGGDERETSFDENIVNQSGTYYADEGATEAKFSSEDDEDETDEEGESDDDSSFGSSMHDGPTDVA